MYQPAPLYSFEMDDFDWNVWTQLFGTSGRIGLELVDDFAGIRSRSPNKPYIGRQLISRVNLYPLSVHRP